MSKKNSIKFVHKYSEIISKNAKKIGITQTEASTIIDEHFKDIKSFLEDYRAPSVSLSKTIKIEPDITKIRSRIKTLITHRRKDKISEEDFKFELVRLWRIKHRMYIQSLGKKNTGKNKKNTITYFEWFNKKEEGFVEEIKKRINGNK